MSSEVGVWDSPKDGVMRKGSPTGMFIGLHVSVLTLIGLAIFAAAGFTPDNARSAAPAITTDSNGDNAPLPDFDGDGTVGFGDFVKFAAKFGLGEGDEGYDAQYDLSGDGQIGFADFLAFAQHFGKEAPSPVVAIPDASLRTAIAAALGKESGAPITAAEMRNLTGRLDLQGLRISDLTGLEFATNVNELWLNNNRRITDVSVLSGLSNLVDLALNGNRITDVSALSGLTKLKFLALDANNLSDVSALSSLTNLIYLTLSDNDLADVSALSGLTNLSSLWLNGNRITDIAALADLTNLETLWLDGNNLSDISALSGFTRLVNLDLNGNRINDVSVLAGLTELEELGLGVTDIMDISILMNLVHLTRLELRGTPLNASSINDHIPALEGRGVTVLFDTLLPQGDFDIELIFLDSFTEAQKRVIRYAARRWTSIIRDDLPDYVFARGWSGNCAGRAMEIPPGERIDDLRLYVITNEGRWAGVDLVREESLLPVVGCMSVGGSGFDTEIHEIAHALGFGTAWFDLGFLNDPDGDAHFNGPLAIAAFEDAGGRDYKGAKVPVAGKDLPPGVALSHWRDTVLFGEVMAAGRTPRGTKPLSAITVQSMADLGYTVDVTQADAYTLPGATAVAKVAVETHTVPGFGVNSFRQDVFALSSAEQYGEGSRGRLPMRPTDVPTRRQEIADRIWGSKTNFNLNGDGQTWPATLPALPAPELTCNAGPMNESIYVVDAQGRIVRTIKR